MPKAILSADLYGQKFTKNIPPNFPSSEKLGSKFLLKTCLEWFQLEESQDDWC